MQAFEGVLTAPAPLPTWSAGQGVRSGRSAGRGRAGRARRYAQIGTILVRSGVVRRWRTESTCEQAALGRSLRVACERAGGVYVKLGQLLSTRPDVVSAGVAGELGRLQNAVAAVPAGRVATVVAEELGARPDLVFGHFDHRPVAAASVAQVHRATLPHGRAVAVKVQRPEIAEKLHRDIDILTRLAERLERHTRWGADQRLVATMRGFAESLTGELDFTAEARNLTALRRVVASHDRVVVPAPEPALTRRRVLVMDWIDGQPLTAAAGSLAPAERTRLARALIGCFLDQIFVAGTFHADPHPGNVHLTTGGDIALLDGGAVGRLDARQRSGLQALLVAVMARDGARMRDALVAVSMGVPGDDRALEAALGRLLDDHLPPGASPDAALFGAFLPVMRTSGLALQPVVYGALRAVATLQATLTALAPGLDLLAEATSWASHPAAA